MSCSTLVKRICFKIITFGRVFYILMSLSEQKPIYKCCNLICHAFLDNRYATACITFNPISHLLLRKVRCLVNEWRPLVPQYTAVIQSGERESAVPYAKVRIKNLSYYVFPADM